MIPLYGKMTNAEIGLRQENHAVQNQQNLSFQFHILVVYYASDIDL